MRKNQTGNGNPPPKDDPTKKPLRQPAPAPDAVPVETEETSDKK